MSIRQIGLGTVALSLFVSNNNDVYAVVKDGIVAAVAVTKTLVPGTIFSSATFTPVETGTYHFVINNVIVDVFDVVTRDVFSFLRNVEDQALGSWTWDKSTKVMSLFRQDGTTLGTYLADDTLETAYQQVSITPPN
jgi:hypothetical protein